MNSQLELIEQRIERLEPGAVIRISDLTKGIKFQKRNREITSAIIMLLNKYGIEYEE